MADHRVIRGSHTTNPVLDWKRITFACPCGFSGAIEGSPADEADKAFMLWADAHEGRLIPNPEVSALPKRHPSVGYTGKG